MKTKKLLTLLALAGIIVFASCKKDDSTPEPLTKSEAETAFTNAESDFTGVAEMLDGQTGLSVLNNFENVGFPGVTKISKPQAESIFTQKDVENLPSFVKGGGGHIYDYDPYIWFDFNSIKGTWTYSEGWSKTSNEPTDKVVLVMPYGEGTATLTYSEYQTGTVDGEAYLSHLKAEYKISTQTTPVMNWVYSAKRTSTTRDYKFVYTIGEYTKTKTYSIDGIIKKEYPITNTIEWSVVWEKGNSVILSRSFTKKVTYNADQTYSVDINGKYRVKDIVIKWAISYNQATDFSNPNNFVTITVWTTEGAKVADIIFKEPIAKIEYVLYIVFNDGTEVPLYEYLDYLGYVIDEFTWFIRYGGEDK